MPVQPLQKRSPLNRRQRMLLRHLWSAGRLSRWELHEQTGLTPNAVGAAIAALIKEHVARECTAEASTGGRPRVPLEISPDGREVIGISIAPGRVEAVRLGLRGDRVEPPRTRRSPSPARLVSIAGEMLREMISRRTLAIGVGVPGFVDPDRRTVLFSSAFPGMRSISIASLYEHAGTLPVMLENDLHATAARWMLHHRALAGEDVLVVNIEDGRLGSSVLINGRPNRGCVMAANEMGHMRLPVQTEPCYCGRVGCLERICSSDFLRRQGGTAGQTLAQAVQRYTAPADGGGDAPLEAMIELLAMGLSNAINFLRPNRLVLASPFVGQAAFADALVSAVRGLLLHELADRVAIDLWEQSADGAADSPAWLALAGLYLEGWSSEG